ncbi:MAG: signal peptidase I [Pseudobdellovibrionaceae bacterium]
MKSLSFLKKNKGFIFFVFVFISFRWSLADQYYVPTGSMEPTIHVGDLILTHKSAYDLKIPFTPFVVKKMADPQRGEIVVFYNQKENLTMVKRLIGMPGDHIEIRDGFVAINGIPFEGSADGLLKIEDPFLEEIFYQEKIGNSLATIKRLPHRINGTEMDFIVPEGKYFMMGDNRDNSLDSRSWGFIERKDIKGRAFAVLYNISIDGGLYSEFDRVGKRLN